ncbi:MAG: PAS domain-containing protein, partial [Chitinophagales bacterium]
MNMNTKKDTKRGKAASHNKKEGVSKDSILINTFLNIPDKGILITDEDGNTEYINSYFEKTCGYNIEEIKGSKPGIFLQGPKTEASSRIAMRKAIKRKQSCNLELINYKKNGEEYLANLKIAPFVTEENQLKFVGIHEIIEDNNKKHQTDNLIRKKENLSVQEEDLSLYKNIHKALNEADITVITDYKGNITYVNNKFCDTSGYSKEEIIGQTHSILYSGYHDKEFYEEMWKTITSGKVWKCVLKNKTKSGEYYWANTVITPFYNPEGKIHQFISISTDITEQIKARELLKNQNEMLREYAFINSHHIRAPLSNILGIIEMLKQDKKLNEYDFVYDLESTAGELDTIIKLLNNIIQGNQAKLDYFSDNNKKPSQIENIWLIDDD